MSENISEKNPGNPWQVLSVLYPDANGVTVASLRISICVLFLCQCPCALASSAAEAVRAVQQRIEQGDLTAARDQLARALKQYPLEPDLHNLRGVVEAQLGNYQSSEAGFLRAIQLAPGASWSNCRTAVAT